MVDDKKIEIKDIFMLEVLMTEEVIECTDSTIDQLKLYHCLVQAYNLSNKPDIYNLCNFIKYLDNEIKCQADANWVKPQIEDY